MLILKKMIKVVGCIMLVTIVNVCAKSNSDAEKAQENAYGVKIKNMLLDRNEHNQKYKLSGLMTSGKPKYITIHNTCNFVSAIDERNYLNSRKDKVYISYHYAVDERGAIRILKDNERGWHAGDGVTGIGNNQSIGIEICRSRCVGKDEGLYRKAEENAIALTAWLMNKYKIPKSNLHKHQDWSKKYCPHRILEEKRWESFKSKVFNFKI